MFGDFIYEFKMHRVLKKVARQRVAMILQPGNVPVIERAIRRDEETKTFLLTAQIRGWVDVLHDNMPTGKVDSNGNMMSDPALTSKETHWKLTDSGWAVIQRRHQLSVLSLGVAIIAVLVGINV
ncbi:TPA: hypothetical protein ACN359_004547 [Vibrio parahaemolyticus]|uniref:hypothetical protein n=1 Tax=Vibrio vulnificus TaxID=672 RepID=UPI00287A8B8C|nr:hypothetical protein [Vibrio vulnificus]MDS1773879.1 hypothetical protein [Vibrio vulnificus]MDS1855037.1 hypothetical protein [Vibrio vulnificus]